MFYREWLEDWLEYYVKVSTKERTYSKYKQQIESYILPVLGNYEINRLSATVLQKFSVTLNERGLAANTANGIISVLKSSLKKAVALGIADKQYSDCIARPKIRERKVICFSKEEQRRIENHIFEKKTPKLFGIILCLYTGLRIGELLALEWGDIDFKTGILTVTKSCHDSWKNNRYVKAIDTTKTNSLGTDNTRSQADSRIFEVIKKAIGLHIYCRRKNRIRYACAYISEDIRIAVKKTRHRSQRFSCATPYLCNESFGSGNGRKDVI